eukprot:CAMPEP_0170524004 /NCGR_PEP_ID=MMETSP0209-20121228/9453_1 /TAXON_ID=665100 ORGANISM="Litonotus pictus, Strain P1" /NCGR_SAMPLE_ID=MMETSP0209 /ASSEMBLY_ACC=CAM_ASM_000301 /LENGTH=613 /DNA_ID=CAMNT_0010812461 /DNA_START=48 /DNA_END=1886 /DNA_ORIENTATION=-
MEMLKSIKEEIIVVSIVGKARTGKSFLLNTLLELNGKAEGFEVDSTINSCTKGIWIWGNVKKRDGNNAKIIFIDSEGTSSIDRSTRTYDSKIFALVVLMSSMFLYNTTSNIDEQGISELSLAAHLSNSIAVDSKLNSNNQSETKDSILSELAPKFLWVIRDFSLEKVHPDTGELISSKEYLEICLSKKISGKNSNENNIIRENIIKYFHDRDCVTLGRPIDSEDDLKNLKKVAFSQLNPEFKSDILAMKSEIYKHSQSKRFQGKKLTGASLFELINIFVKTINEGGVPNISNAWESVIMNDINDHYQKALNIYTALEKEYSDLFRPERKVTESIPYEELVKRLTTAKKESLLCLLQVKMMNRDAFSFNKRYNIHFEDRRNSLVLEIKKINKRLFLGYDSFCEKLNENILRVHAKEIERDISNRTFNEKNYLNFVDAEEKYCGSCKAELSGRKALSMFCNSLLNMVQSALESIEANLSIAFGKKHNENKVIMDDLDFQMDSESNRVSTLTETVNSQENRIANKMRDFELNKKEIEQMQERITEIEERINIKKKARDAKIAAIKEQERLEQERERERKLEEARKQAEAEKNNEEEDDPAHIQRRQRNKEKKENCN